MEEGAVLEESSRTAKMNIHLIIYVYNMIPY